jgi:hypothetical protein
VPRASRIDAAATPATVRAGGATVETDGTRSRVPSGSTFAGSSPFARASAVTVVPNLCAIEVRLSPARAR